MVEVEVEDNFAADSGLRRPVEMSPVASASACKEVMMKLNMTQLVLSSHRRLLASLLITAFTTDNAGPLCRTWYLPSYHDRLQYVIKSAAHLTVVSSVIITSYICVNRFHKDVKII